MGKASSGFTRGAIDAELASALRVFPVALAVLSFLTFLIEPPCFPPSAVLF